MADLLTLFSNNSSLALTADALHNLAIPGHRADRGSRPNMAATGPLAARFTPEERSQLLGRYEAGESARSLAAEFEVANSALINFLRSQAVFVRPNRTITDALTLELQWQHASGISMGKLEKKYGLTHSVVFRAIHRTIQ